MTLAPGALGVLTSPPVLFFLLGAFAAAVRSDLKLPEQVAKGLSLYLMLCIGFKGGVSAREAGLGADFAAAAGIGVALSALTPLAAYMLLKLVARFDRATLCATAAAFGSVSVVTFAAGQDHLASLGATPSGHMAAVLALMETPAILTALLLMRGRRAFGAGVSEVLRDVFFNAAALLLVGSFVVGLVSSEAGAERLEVFTGPFFQGALCLFLLDLGSEAVRRLAAARGGLGPGVVAFSTGFPVLGAGVALVAASAAGLQPADAAMLAVLAASASYIAVPAAMRIAAPDADPGVYVTTSMAITFPFNLLIGIPLYAHAAGLSGAG